MRAFIVASAGAAIFLLILIRERLVLDARLKRIPLRVCIAGSRGKSTVTRLVAGALRASGARVLAKTTGSRAVLILPDGSEREIRRWGLPNILEQKRLVRLAARLGAGALVTETMSIREECLSVEARLLLRPNVLVVTNVRLDHIELMGETKEEIAACLAAAIPRNGIVIISEEETLPVFVERAEKLGARLVLVRKGPGPASGAGGNPGTGVFEENVRLALETARVLGVDEASARNGIACARPDFGSLRAWELPGNGAGPPLAIVSAFAANDPESSRKALDKILGSPGFAGRTLIGLLNLRRDRGDRTLQWARAFEGGKFDEFERVALLGGHARAMARRLARKEREGRGRFFVLSERSPEAVIGRLSRLAKGPALVVGMGNIAGPGAGMVDHWERTGRPLGF